MILSLIEYTKKSNTQLDYFIIRHLFSFNEDFSTAQKTYERIRTFFQN